MREKKGTTLIEMMAAIAILAFVALAVIMALVSIQQAWLKQKSGIELFNNARWAMESMVNEIRRGCNYTVYATVGVDGLRFRSPLVADTEYIFYWRGDGTTYGNNDAIFRGVGADLSSANSSSSRKEVVNLVANTSSVFSVSDNNLVAIELTVRKGSRSCVLKSKARPRNRDPYAKLLLHMDGTDGATSFPDSAVATHNVTAIGNAQVDTAQSKFGGASALFNGSGDYLTVPDSDDWAFGTGYFTIDFWVRYNNTSGDIGIYGHGPSNGFFMYTRSSDSTINVVIDAGATMLFSGTWAPVINTWYHVALVRNANNWYWFINGSQIATTVNPSLVGNYTGVAAIGSAVGGGNPFSGWLEELRISKDIARWTSNFTPLSMDY